ncbi:MAG: N-acetylmuramoyl-L-alanine amidase [Clostridiales bacterium]|nr:N-acetylmuramoyl-L-alanine amidase [Clostridiales bacterium]
MSNSTLVDYVKISPNRTSPRNHAIDRITIHHMAGNLSVETCGNVFAPSSRQASSNYGIDSDGRVGMYVEEKDRSWCSSNKDNDHRAVTIEVADDVIGNGWHSSDKAMNKLVELCTDICKRNGIAKLNYTGDTNGNLTMHKWFAATDCPGEYLESKFPWIAEQVNKRLSGEKEEPKLTQNPGERAYKENRINYRVHQQSVGWLPHVEDGQVAGVTGHAKRIEAIKIDCKMAGVKIHAKGHIQGVGWKDYGMITSDTVIGTTGQEKRLEAISLEAEGLPEGMNIYVRYHIEKEGWSEWIKGGTVAGTVGLGKRLEAIQIKIQ